MNNETNVASMGVARSEAAKRNYNNGFDAGVRTGLEMRSERDTVTGFWYGVGASAVIVMIVWLNILWGKL